MPAGRRSQHPTGVLFVLLLAGVSFALSQTLVVPALTAISREFDLGILSRRALATTNLTAALGSAAAAAAAILAAHTHGATPVPTEGAYEAAFLMSAACAVLAIGAALLVPRPAARAAEASA